MMTFLIIFNITALLTALFFSIDIYYKMKIDELNKEIASNINNIKTTINMMETSKDEQL